VTTTTMRRWTGLAQIAMSVLDLDDTVGFYERCFGYGRNGGVKRLFNGNTTDKVLAHEDVRHELRWMSDRDPRFQLELVSFENPPARPMAEHERVCDIGYRRMAIWVEYFDGTLARLRDEGVPLLGEPRDYGDGRRACCRDPNGVVLELLEKDVPSPPDAGDEAVYDLPVRTRAVSLSVPSLPEAEAFFEGTLGMERADFALHTPAMEEMWGLAGAETRSSLFWAGRHLVELVEYVSPRGKPRPAEEHLGDAGIYHMALRFRRNKHVTETWREVTEAGYGSRSAPANLLLAKLVYLRSPHDFMVECLYYHRWIGRFIGFRGQVRR
jgi:catechol 2,3-dioxygenase-like lactoylglutathione lyase family enzyme